MAEEPTPAIRPPLYKGMPPRDVVYTVPRAGAHRWGRIRCGGACNDHYARLETRHLGDGRVVTLQRAAMDSYLSAARHVGASITLTGSFRSCSQQTSLYRQDPARFANPNTTAHCRGLAIDVSTELSVTRLRKIHAALVRRDWYQARSDEPWHYSFGIEV